MRGTASVIAVAAAHDPVDLVVSSVTTYELLTGVEKCADPARERGKVERLLTTIRQVDFDLSAASAAANIRADLESRGEMIGPYDVLIAGVARSQGMVLVTDNLQEFVRVSGLTVENWLTATPGR